MLKWRETDYKEGMIIKVRSSYGAWTGCIAGKLGKKLLVVSPAGCTEVRLEDVLEVVGYKQ